MAERRISAFFDTYEGAARAVQRLEGAGVPHHDLSLLASDAHAHHVPAEEEPESSAAELAGAGAAAGTVAGGGAGLLAGLGTVAVPGFGAIVAAGWLVSTLIGAGLGAATGGLVGALMGAGFDETEANDYADQIGQGAVLVTVRVDDADVDRVVDILDDDGEIATPPGNGAVAAAAEAPAPPIGAAASTSTGLLTDLMPIPADEDSDHLAVEIEDERLRRMTGTDRNSGKT